MKNLCKSLLLSILLADSSGYSQEKTTTADSPPIAINLQRLPAALSLSMVLRDDNHNAAIDAEEQGSLEVTLKNDGPGKAYALHVAANVVQTVGGLKLDTGAKEVPVLLPGKSTTLTFSWSAGEQLVDSRLAVRLSATEKFNNVPAPKEITMETRALVPPDLQVTDIGLDDDDQGESYGNSNGKIEKGESVEIEAVVQNRGQGEAGNVTVKVESSDANLFFLSQREFALGDLPPGEFRKVKFAFTVPPNYTGAPRLPLSLQISESRGRFGKTVPLALELNQATKRATELVAEKVEIKGNQRQTVDIADAPSLTVDVDINIPPTTTSRPDAIAVVIGNRYYSGKDVPGVDYAIRDAAVMKEYLLTTLGYREGNVIYWENATKAQFEATFGTPADHRGRLFNLVKSGKSEVFIYYSGHGAPDPESRQGYFVPVDCDPSLVRLNGYSLNTFYANLAKLNAASMVVVIDACFSGVSQGGSLLRQISPVRIAVENPLLVLPNAVIFTSATGDQVSSWYADKKHSLFTYFFLKGLRGEADKNADKILTLQELADFVSDGSDGVPYWARRLHNREQTPMVSGAKGMTLVKY